jgi:hypothetical protein
MLPFQRGRASQTRASDGGEYSREVQAACEPRASRLAVLLSRGIAPAITEERRFAFVFRITKVDLK